MQIPAKLKNMRNTILFIFALLFAWQNTNAQIGWSAQKAKGAGDLVAVYFTSAKDGYVAGDKGFLAWTKDGGKNWAQQDLNTTEDISEIYFRNDDNGYLVAGKKMFMTANGGRNWQETKIYRASDFKTGTPEFLSIRFPEKKLGFVIGSILGKNKDGEDIVVDSLLMRTNDGGETWSRVNLPVKTELYHLDFVSGSSGWIVGDKGTILITQDGGLTWTRQKSGTDKSLFNVDFRDEREGCAVGGKGTILKTANGGVTWETIKTNFPSTFLRINFADDKNAWIVGYKGTILRSSDRGNTWVKQESNTQENLYGLFMTKKYGWAVGSNGAVVEYLK